MNRLAAVLLALCLCTSALAQTAPAPSSPPPPAATTATPAALEKTLDDWLAAFNSGDRATIEAFGKRYQYPVEVEDMQQFREDVGGFTLVRREPGDAQTARALLREKDSEDFARVEITRADGQPMKISVRGTPPPPEFKPARLDPAGAVAAVAAHADEATRKDAFAGVILIAQGNDVLLERAWGEADRGKHIPNAIDTRFRLGSMNKMITSVATLQLVQAGKLSLDGTIGTYLKDYPNKEIRTVTIRQLLTHSGGTGDIFGPEYERERLNLRTHGDYVKLFGARGPTHPPGSKRAYSNYGFVLLGAIIEAVSGQSYYDYVAEHIYAPAGMRDSGSEPENTNVPRRAIAYRKKDGAWVDAADTLPYRGMAAGGGYSTAGDLLRFARALQNGTLVSPALLEQATHTPDGRYGFGFAVGEVEGARWYGHGGGAPGMNADFRVFPALDRVVITLSNLDPPRASRESEYYFARMPVPAASTTAAPAK